MDLHSPHKHLATALARALAVLSVLSLLAMATAMPAHAEDVPTVRIELNDGHINVRRIELPARQRFRVEVVNQGKTPAEFESLPLGLELVVAPGGTRTRALPGKSAGTYPFYDEFHMETTRGEFVIR
ncbi:MAG: cupredoxin domain-containing protein [Comamonas sp.]|nr:cupredoxin domain-containing protein [Comamonas sp.]